MVQRENETALDKVVGRRPYLKQTAGAMIGSAALLAAGETSAAATTTTPPSAQSTSALTAKINLQTVSKSPVLIKSVELLRYDKYDFVRTTSTDGATGISITNGRP